MCDIIVLQPKTFPLALAITLSTVFIPKTVHNETELQAVKLGYPLSFETYDLSRLSPPSFPRTYSYSNINFLENSSEFSWLNFLLSYAVILGSIELLFSTIKNCFQKNQNVTSHNTLALRFSTSATSFMSFLYLSVIDHDNPNLLSYNTIMDFTIKNEDYIDLCKKIFTLIKKEIETATDAEAQYPKVFIMYEFFRLLRGEAFATTREPTPKFQKELYQMEDELHKELLNIKSQIKNWEKCNHYIENLQRDLKL